MAANNANSKLSTDLSVTPYYDDFDVNKNFYRILYKPGFAVQARELTQSQTILQNQIKSIGTHLFRDGSIVLPGAFTIQTSVNNNAPDYVKIRDLDTANELVNVQEYLGAKLTGVSSGVTAYVSLVADGSETEDNTKTFVINYMSASPLNPDVVTFQNGEVLNAAIGNTNIGSVTVLSSDATGKSSIFNIEEGVVYAKGHFISFATQSVILDRYNDNPTCKVGFFIDESIVRVTEDSTLLDPALESSNYAAPGADRFRLSPRLAVLNFVDPSTLPDFVTLFTIKDGIIETINERTQYNILRDELAKRTFDESGDYYVNGLDIRLRENLNTGNNLGLLTQEEGGNSSILSVSVEPGLAYVKGYEIGTLVSTPLTTDKGTTFTSINSQLASTSMGSYVTVDEFVGSWQLDQGIEIDLYDTAQNRISEKKWSVTAQGGTKIGTARFQSIEYVSGIPGYNAVYNVYLTDIRMIGTNAFSSVRNLYRDNSPHSDIGADIVLEGGKAILYGINDAALLYYVGSNSVKSLRDPSEPSAIDTTFSFYRTSGVGTTLEIATTGILQISLPGGTEIFPYGNSTLSNTNKREVFLTINESFDIALPGTVDVTGNVVTGVSTQLTRLNVGDKVKFDTDVNVYYVQSITDNNTMTLASNIAAPLTGVSLSKTYRIGDVIDLTGKGVAAGETRSVVATSTSLTIDLKETFASPIDATVTYRVARTSALEVQKLLRSSRYVKIDCSTAGTTGPFNLGISDVLRIKSIRKGVGAYPANSTDGTDLTRNFIFDNGQRDAFYDHAKITPTVSLSASDRLLVELDYFEPNFTSRAGYFSVDSYPVNDSVVSDTTIRTEEIPIFKSPISGTEYNLRNHLDFRPLKTNTASNATAPSGASVNPANSTGFNFPGAGMRMPVPYSQLTFDYTFYLSRKDLVVVDKDKNFSIIKGIPGVLAITPSAPENTMTLAILSISPYPSLAPSYAQKIKRKDLACKTRKVATVRQTMRDIGVIKDRVSNLEYYAALNLLEKAAVDLRVMDSNGLDRFKNGIFVDPFNNHLLGATYRTDYRIVVDPQEKSIRPIFTMDSFYYDYMSGTNIKRSGDIITLDYSEVLFHEQTAATTTRNTERNTFRFIGIMDLDPETDVWVDTQIAPDQALTFGVTDSQETEISGYLSTEWNAWQTRITGYNVYSGTGSSRTLVATTETEAEALSIADRLRRTTDVTVETLYESTREGTETTMTVTSDTQSLGERVVDVDLVPYIRPQTITIYVGGLKPYTRMYVFFDGEDMNAYSKPLTREEYLIPATRRGVTVSSEGAPIRASENGEAYIALRLPAEKRFTVGTKRIDVVDTPSNAVEDITTFATGYFTAMGLVQTKQETVLTTRYVIPEETEVTETDLSSTSRTLARIRPSTGCIAYSMLPKSPNGTEGLFITSVDVYCAEKHPTLGVWFEIREMDAAGGITRNQVPFSKVVFESADVPISPDGQTNPLRVTFQAPIFLFNNVQYAFVIHPIASNPNYYFWVSRLGQTDVNTGLPVTGRAMTGTFYTTNNDTNWDMVPDLDLTCKFYRASFSTNEGVVTLGNRAVQKLLIESVPDSVPFGTVSYGVTVSTGDTIEVIDVVGTGPGGNTGVVLEEGDQIRGNTSNTLIPIRYISGKSLGLFKTGAIQGEIGGVFYANGSPKDIQVKIDKVENGRGVLSKFRGYNPGGANTPHDLIIISTSDANTTFSANLGITTFPNTITSIGQASQPDRVVVTANNVLLDYSDVQEAQIIEVQDFRYTVVDFEPAYLTFGRTSVDFEMRTYSNTKVAGNFTPINPNENYYFNTERAVFSRSNEIEFLGGDKSNQVRATLRTLSDYLSPVIDTGRTHTVYVDSIINDDVTGEDGASGGGLINRYISKTVTLAEGQDAEDLTLVLTSYRPPTTDVKVWVKILHAEDATTFDQRNWIELEMTEDDLGEYSSLANRNDFKEYVFGFPLSMLTGPNGAVQYQNENGITFTGYKNFAVKIGLLGTNSAVLPRVADLRVIALQR
jgi:hypothetical protein